MVAMGVCSKRGHLNMRVEMACQRAVRIYRMACSLYAIGIQDVELPRPVLEQVSMRVQGYQREA